MLNFVVSGSTMKEIRGIAPILCRMFSRKTAFAGIRKKIKFVESNESVESLDPDDVSEFEADFMNVGLSHKMYEKEMEVKKERLKRQIVTRKYFKEIEPRFLTYAEKELICKLHRSNPEEWVIEKLSESFPALPETIRKILRSKWSPQSVERILEYDKVVIKNWKDFRAGKLPLSSELNEHLVKFKDRKLILTDRETLAKQFVSKIEFKTPRSQLFSSIIQTYLNEKESDVKLLSQDSGKIASKSENQNLLTASTTTDSPIKNTEKLSLSNKQSSTLQSSMESQGQDKSFNKKKEKLLTFNEFVKVNLEDIQKESPEEGAVLLDLYRKQIDANQEIPDIAAPIKKDASKLARRSDIDIFLTPEEKEDRKLNHITTDENLLDTSIKMWKKKIDTEFKYAKKIKIAKHLYKPGMTYRINDCYYDDDGEFLYRVPGVYN